jgi:hypothetical protein
MERFAASEERAAGRELLDAGQAVLDDVERWVDELAEQRGCLEEARASGDGAAEMRELLTPLPRSSPHLMARRNVAPARLRLIRSASPWPRSSPCSFRARASTRPRERRRRAAKSRCRSPGGDDPSPSAWDRPSSHPRTGVTSPDPFSRLAQGRERPPLELFDVQTRIPARSCARARRFWQLD